ncbi:MAG TPA: glycosyltransferase [Anaerolineae bacterium]|nr:glycosyltransferase [Anaerolineae bacterium]
MSPRQPILFLCQVLPYPLDAGPKVRAYHMLRALAALAPVTLVCFQRQDDPPAALAHLRGICEHVVTVPMRRSRLRDAWHLAQALLSGGSFIIRRDERAAMRRTLADLCRRQPFAAVHADQLWMAAYARDLPVPLKVLDQHNAVYLIFQRLAAGERNPLKRWLWHREAVKLAAYEAAQLAAFDHSFFVSREDQQAIAAVADEAGRRRLETRSSILPICVDTAAIVPIDAAADSSTSGATRVTFLGTLFWPPNAEGVLWFAAQVWPRILERCPTARLTLIGKNPPAAVLALVERYGPSVEITGYVADPRPLLAQTAAFIVPLLSGGGMRVKILDAWAWGLPVVATPIGAEGIDSRPGEDILIAEDPAAFAEHVVQLLADPARRAALGAAGRRAVEARYDRRLLDAALARVYGSVLGWDADG